MRYPLHHLEYIYRHGLKADATYFSYFCLFSTELRPWPWLGLFISQGTLFWNHPGDVHMVLLWLCWGRILPLLPALLLTIGDQNEPPVVKTTSVFVAVQVGFWGLASAVLETKSFSGMQMGNGNASLRLGTGSSHGKFIWFRGYTGMTGHVYVMGFPSRADVWPKFHWEFGIVWLLLG